MKHETNEIAFSTQTNELSSRSHGAQEEIAMPTPASIAPTKFQESAPAPCKNCGKTGYCTRPETLRMQVSGFAFRASQTVLRCVSCGHTQWPVTLLRRFRLQIAAWFAQQGIQNGQAFKFMRKTLGLKAVELSRLLSLAPETVSRWERCHRPCDSKAVTILGTMVLDRLAGHDSTMQRLRALQAPPPEPTPIDLTDALRNRDFATL